MRRPHLLTAGWLVLLPSMAFATPSTTYWAPSTAACQAYGVPHVTYDTYYGKGPAVGASGAPGYPIDTGLTAGLLPFKKIQAEAGFDLLLPSPDPVYLNFKLCTPEAALFRGSPGLGFGVYNIGFKKDATNYDVVYLMAQKSLPKGGYVAAGFYHGMNQTLFTNSDGKVAKSGFMAAWVSPDIPINRAGLKKLVIATDVQTGKNVLGAWGVGVGVYFTDNVALLLGPVVFFDKNLQPGARRVLFTTQLDIDIPLGRNK